MKFLSLPVRGCAVLLVLAGCAGGSAGMRSLPPGAATLGGAAESRTAPEVPSISGVVKTTNWIVPKGKTVVVNRTLAVFASDSIEVDGTLIVESGASIGLISGGSLTMAGTMLRGLTDHPGSALSSPGVAILGGRDVTVSGRTQFDGNVSIATSGGGDVTIRGDMSVEPGAGGTSAALPSAPGGAHSGGTIAIGTSSAVLDIDAWIGKYDPHLTDFNPGAPDVLTISNHVRAGDGGDGYSDVDGKADGFTQVLVAGDGASGGNVELQGRRIVMGKALVAPGNGGSGGDAGFNAVSGGEEFHVSMDGDAHDARAHALHATLGNGGNAGTVSTSGFAIGNPGHASGGASGSLSYAHAGNGGPAAPGGATTILTGTVGTGFTAGQPGDINLHDGGNGGASNSVQAAGGAGGSIAITDSTGGTAIFHAHTSQLSGYANGGAGFNGCPTQTIGTNGGSATTLNVSKRQFGYIASSFDGGNGGDGIGPAGAGGSPGHDVKYATIGATGASGGPCNSNFAFIVDQGGDVEEYSVGSNFEPNPLFALNDPVGEAATGAADPVNPYYYVANGNNNTVAKDTLDVFSLTSSGHATYLTGKPLTGEPAAVVSDGTYVYVATSSGQLSIFSAGSTLSPIGTASTTNGAALSTIALDANNVFVGDGSGGVWDFPRLSGGALGTAVEVGSAPGGISALFDTGTDLYFTSGPTYVCDGDCSAAKRAARGRAPRAIEQVPAMIWEYAIGAGGATQTGSFQLGVGPLRSIECTAALCFVSDQYDQAIWQFSIGSGGILTPLPTAGVTTSEEGMSLTSDPSETHLYLIEGPGQVQAWSITPSGLTPLFTQPLSFFAAVGMSFYDFSAASLRHAR